jgi:hypothetical protein
MVGPNCAEAKLGGQIIVPSPAPKISKKVSC